MKRVSCKIGETRSGSTAIALERGRVMLACGVSLAALATIAAKPMSTRKSAADFLKAPKSLRSFGSKWMFASSLPPPHSGVVPVPLGRWQDGSLVGFEPTAFRLTAGPSILPKLVRVGPDGREFSKWAQNGTSQSLFAFHAFCSHLPRAA